jgi:hypothetical protein
VLQRKLPSTEEVKRLRDTTFPEYPTVFGALDITESPRARVLREERVWYSGKQGTSTMMTITIFSEHGRLLGWETGFPGHNNDIGVWQQSELRKWLEEVNKELSPPGQVTDQLLADGGFPGDEFTVIPLRKADIETEEERQKVKEQAKLRVIAENGFGEFKDMCRFAKVETRKC